MIDTSRTIRTMAEILASALEQDGSQGFLDDLQLRHISALALCQIAIEVRKVYEVTGVGDER